MLRRMWLVLLPLALLFSAQQAHAIIFGTPDNREHPYVGELLFYDPDEPDSRFNDPGTWFTCTGTLVSPTIVVTAGHCTYGVGLNGTSTRTPSMAGSGGNDMWIDFSEEAHFAGFPPSSDYGVNENEQRYEDRVTWLDASPYWHRGTAIPEPLFTEANFFVHDVGVVRLDHPVYRGTYAAIPPLHYLNRYEHTPRNEQRFEVVGYGLERSGPKTALGGDTRRKGLVKLNNLKSAPPETYIIVSGNAGRSHRGGTCFGDSGGPTFDGTNSNLLVAVTSFGVGAGFGCKGIGGAYRLDEPDDLAFLARFGIKP
jgi:hypothetical protein